LKKIGGLYAGIRLHKGVPGKLGRAS
jgi:hypothetical protein